MTFSLAIIGLQRVLDLQRLIEVDFAFGPYQAVTTGVHPPTYVLLLTRNNLADIETAGPTLAEMLGRAYGSTRSQVSEVLRQVQSVHTEVWDYEPRLALIPGHGLEP